MVTKKRVVTFAIFIVQSLLTEDKRTADIYSIQRKKKS